MIKIILKLCCLLLISALSIPKANAQVEGQKTICNNEPIPAGWIKVDIIPCIGCCGASVGVNSAWYVIKKIDDAPLFTIEKICFDVPIPKGWIKIRSERCACCGRIGEMYSKNHIMRVDSAPLNTEREICYDSPIPAGWVKISVNDKCGGCCGDELGVFGVQYVIKKVDKDPFNLQEEPAPLNSVERVCQDSPIPAGWVKTGNETCGFCCGSNSLNKSIIKKVDEPGVISVLPSDSLALVDLFNSTNGGSWKNNKNWLAQRKVATWFGVTVSGGRITSLALRGNNLTGKLPELNLPNLIYLDLFDNKLTGNLPTFSNTPALQYMWLGINQFSGSIPNFNLPNLRDMYLGQNQLTGTLPNFSSLPSLQNINIEFNKFSGGLPNWNLPNLIMLDVNFDQLSGPIPPLDKMPNLKYLYLLFNSFEGPIPNFNLPNLTQMKLQVNKLSGPIPDFKMPKLTILDLSWNLLTGAIPNFNFPELQDLILNNNRLYGPVPVFNYPMLKNLALGTNKFTFDGFEHTIKKYPFVTYVPQDTLLQIHANDSGFSLSAGGTLENNTYNWYRNDTLISTIKADSTYKATLQGKYYVTVSNSIASNLILKSRTINYSITSTSVNEEIDSKIKVFPNPASTQLIIELPSNLQVKNVSIFNLQGIQVGKIDNQRADQFIIHLNHFAKGIYVLEINTNEGFIHRRVTVY